MNFLIIISEKDLASLTLGEKLKEKPYSKVSGNLYKLDIDGENNIYFKEITTRHIYSKQEDIIPKDIKVDNIIFLSKHSTLNEFKPKAMTVHAIGNWGKAELGGKDSTIVKTDPILIRSLLMALKKNKPKNIKSYEVKQEATHHGPYLDYSTIFYEIGSQESDWSNKDVAKYMIDILLDTIKNYDKQKIISEKNWIPAVGVGGSHYCTRFNKKTFQNSNQFAFGHVAPNYVLEDVRKNPDILEQAKEKSNAKRIIKEEEL